MTWNRSKTLLLLTAFLAASCRPPQSKANRNSELSWGVHSSGKSANLITLRPNESVEVCAPGDDWLDAAKGAIEQWSSALGRWGHFKINP